MATNESDPGVEVAHYLAGLYEVQRDADRLPDTTGLLYGYVPDGHYCLVCLRRYEPRLREGDGGRGGPRQRYCGPACRRRATDRRRRSLPRESYGHVPGAPDLSWEAPANLLHLGPPIRPDHRVLTGKGIWPNAPMVVDIDLLLTSATITETREATKARRSE